MNLKDAIDFTKSVRETWSEDAKGYQTIRINTNHLVRILGGDMEMSTVDNLTFTNLTAALKFEGKAAATINRIQAALSTIHSTLVKYGYLDKNVQKTSLREPKGRTLFYTDNEVKRLLEACDELGYKGVVVKDVIRFGYLTGARQGEILKLTWDDINYDDNTLQFVDTKNGDTRVLPITQGLHELLSEVWDRRLSNEEVFPIDKDALIRRFNRVKEIAGINPEKVFHTLRHTAATALFAKGAALPVVKQILGHKSTETTLRYAKATNDGMVAALNSIALHT
jgi:integrase